MPAARPLLLLAALAVLVGCAQDSTGEGDGSVPDIANGDPAGLDYVFPHTGLATPVRARSDGPPLVSWEAGREAPDPSADEQVWTLPVPELPLDRIPEEYGDASNAVIAGRADGSGLQLAVFEALNPTTDSWDVCYIVWDVEGPGGGLIGCALPDSPGIGVHHVDQEQVGTVVTSPDYVVWGPLPEPTELVTLKLNGAVVAQQRPSVRHVLLRTPLNLGDRLVLVAHDAAGSQVAEAEISVL